MIIDLIVGITLLVFGIWGARRGLIKQIALIASIVLMFIFTSPVADIFSNIIADHSKLDIPSRYLHVLLSSLVATGIFVFINLIGLFLHRTLVKGIKPVETANKAFGFTVGILSSAGVIYFVLCLANCSMGWIAEYAPSLEEEIRASASFGITREYNFIEERMPEFARRTGRAELHYSSPGEDEGVGPAPVPSGTTLDPVSGVRADPGQKLREIQTDEIDSRPVI